MQQELSLIHICGVSMASEYDLIHTMKELSQMKEKYVKVQSALEAVRGTGYGAVSYTHLDVYKRQLCG